MRPETISDRMRVAAKYLDFYDEIIRNYTIPLLKDWIARNPAMSLKTYNETMRIIDDVEVSVYPISSSREIQEDLEDDAEEVERLQEFYNAIIESSLEHYSIAQESIVPKDYNENQ